jgi:molybdopterin-guanine dinucleotide biosynthesis protein A
MPESISSQLSAAIIAGGKSRRFGSPKALASFGKKLLIDYSIETAKTISHIVMLNYGDAEIFAGRGIPLIQDIFPGCGPLGGIHAVLYHARTEWVAVLPCDLPLLTPRIYGVMFTLRKNDRPVVALSERGIEPLVSIWPKLTERHVKQYINKGNLMLHGVLRELQAIEVYIPQELPDYSPEMFLNVNRIEDLEKIKGILKR